MKSKRRKRSSRKGRGVKAVALLLLAGTGLLLIYLFHQELLHAVKPFLARWGLSEEKRVVVLYFSDPEGEYLVGERREISKKGNVGEEASEAIIELIKGPRGKLIPTIPAKTKLLNLEVDARGVANVNFDRVLSKGHPGGSSAEMMTLYSIVNSLSLNFPQIKRVQIVIEGKPAESIAGHISLEQPVSPKPDLVKKSRKK